MGCSEARKKIIFTRARCARVVSRRTALSIGLVASECNEGDGEISSSLSALAVLHSLAFQAWTAHSSSAESAYTTQKVYSRAGDNTLSI